MSGSGGQEQSGDPEGSQTEVSSSAAVPSWGAGTESWRRRQPCPDRCRFGLLSGISNVERCGLNVSLTSKVVGPLITSTCVFTKPYSTKYLHE